MKLFRKGKRAGRDNPRYEAKEERGVDEDIIPEEEELLSKPHFRNAWCIKEYLSFVEDDKKTQNIILRYGISDTMSSIVEIAAKAADIKYKKTMEDTYDGLVFSRSEGKKFLKFLEKNKDKVIYAYQNKIYMRREKKPLVRSFSIPTQTSHIPILINVDYVRWNTVPTIKQRLEKR